MIALAFLEINNNKNSFLFESFEVQILGKKHIRPLTPSSSLHISKIRGANQQARSIPREMIP